MCSRQCRVIVAISNRLWRHLHNVIRASEKQCRCVKIVVFVVISGSVCRVRNNKMYVLSWRIVSSLTRGLFWCLFQINTQINLSLLRDSGCEHQNKPFVSTEKLSTGVDNVTLFYPMSSGWHNGIWACHLYDFLEVIYHPDELRHIY